MSSKERPILERTPVKQNGKLPPPKNNGNDNRPKGKEIPEHVRRRTMKKIQNGNNGERKPRKGH